MKRNIKFLVFLMAAASVIASTASDSAAKQFRLNKSVGSPSILFISKAPIEDIEGSVREDAIKSELNFDPAKAESSTGKIFLEVKGMETGIKRRDEHLYGKDWLDAAFFPNITFELSKISGLKADNQQFGKIIFKGNAEGNITIHGKSKYITSNVTITYLKESSATKQRASGDLLFAEGKFDVALKDFDVKGIKGLVGSKVGEVINIEFKLFYNSID